MPPQGDREGNERAVIALLYEVLVALGPNLPSKSDDLSFITSVYVLKLTFTVHPARMW